jgi:hypothetical protein
MKIRTDFVTNSSSISNSEIVIDNPVLLEILQKYRDVGAFGAEKPFFGIGEYFSYEENFEDPGEDAEPDYPSFYYYEERYTDGWPRVWDCPKTLGEVLGKIIEVIDEAYDERYVKFDKEIMKQMKAELSQRAEEIKENFVKVYWTHEDITEWFGNDQIVRWFYSYDPVNGEKHLETKAGDAPELFD